jgi:hypothetical protein
VKHLAYQCNVRLAANPRRIASRIARSTTASVSAGVIISISPSAPMRKPHNGSSHVGTIIFFFRVIVSLLFFTALALDARSSCVCGSEGRISNFFERGANGIIQNFVAFRLWTHRQHVGGLAGQVEQSIPDAQEHLFNVPPDGREPRKLAGFIDPSVTSSLIFHGSKTL